MNLNINLLQEQLEEEFKYNLDSKYSDILENASYYKTRINRVKEESKIEDEYIDKVYFSWLLDLSIIHQEYLIFKNEKDFCTKKHTITR